MVAEKNSVWRSAGMAAMIFLTVGRKPMSSMRSASSRTRMRTLPRSTSLRPRKSNSRPGVAMSTCAPLRMACNCASLAEAADDDGGANAGARGHLGEGLVDLHGEFARGAEDDGADAGGCGLLR